jgi:outer membrane protein OmpA-like peptidoglycan-associated protein
MKRYIAVFAALLWLVAETGEAQDVVFVEEADDMVNQMLGGAQQYGRTRSFVVVEEQTRGISVRRKNSTGQEETVVVQVPAAGIDPAARLKVEFDVDSANLRATAYQVLGELGKALRDERVVDHNVCIKGHTDSDGDEGYNLDLSYARANTVKEYLKGASAIPAQRLQVFGYGENMPLVENDSPWHKQTNRRVEVSLNCPEISSR